MKLRRRKSIAGKGPVPLQLQAAYAVCRSISRSAARNFYYSFLALPREKRDAICAVYAFMRHADDISDEPGQSPAERRVRLADWLERLHRVIAGEPTDEPVLMALADAQRRYAIPVVLLEKLVAGTAMDVAEASGAPAGEAQSATKREERVDTARPSAASQSNATAAAVDVAITESLSPAYESFDQLYDYCYHVASVVGLIVIRIFGYSDPAAEPLAEHTGIAFQLTNIIRDVKEDAAMNRVYFPREDFDRFGVNANEIKLPQEKAATRLRPLLEFEAQRAREYYRSAVDLLPLIDEDSRPALWVLVTIYRRLLEKIAARNYDVFGEKVRLSFWEKFSVLARGLWQRIA